MTWSFYCTISYRIFVEIHVLLKCSGTKKFRIMSSDLAVLTHSYEHDDWGWVSRKHLKLESSPWRNRFFDKIPTSALRLVELCWKGSVCLCWSPEQHLDIFYSDLSPREPPESQPLVDLFRNSLGETILHTCNTWNLVSIEIFFSSFNSSFHVPKCRVSPHPHEERRKLENLNWNLNSWKFEEKSSIEKEVSIETKFQVRHYCVSENRSSLAADSLTQTLVEMINQNECGEICMYMLNNSGVLRSAKNDSVSHLLTDRIEAEMITNIDLYRKTWFAFRVCE